ncbi:hypothetical protein MANES_04G074600v8 [Manihot esculenta]|uniref:Uncharacterized protein n=1 Tax=Manihot esculenta TaxID=3983 RepID=A0A2C9W2P2_MANES|nr:hypothetical protein MANES_04G074600v8 [Manihot esculenta]
MERSILFNLVIDAFVLSSHSLAREDGGWTRLQKSLFSFYCIHRSSLNLARAACVFLLGAILCFYCFSCRKRTTVRKKKTYFLLSAMATEFLGLRVSMCLSCLQIKV